MIQIPEVFTGSTVEREGESGAAWLAELPDVRFRPEEVEQVRQIGDNTGCMMLKGASKRHTAHGDRADEWPMRPELLEVAGRYGLGEEW